MKRLVLTLFAGACLLLLPGLALAEARLKPVVLVDGPEVTFADLFIRAGAGGEKVFAAAPPPGERAIYRPQTVQAMAAQVGISWSPDPGLRAVVVERAGRTVPREEILRRLAEALDLGDAGGGQAIILPGNIAMMLPVGVDPEIRVEDVDFDRHARRFHATIVASDGADAQRLRVQGRVQQVSEVPVLRQAVSAGQVIGEADIEWVGVPSLRLGGNVLTDMTEIVGQAARRSLPPGRPLRASDLQRPSLVSKGALVSMSVTVPNMQLSAIGRALEAGAAGEVIQIMNLQSKRTVTGVVVGPNQVEVGAARIAAALN
ncbi:MAG: flagellar basal body P-ring formation protein FlgA [Alphaproteobacteria bacterium]|nr:flagellar basal body P-ring formation protein FlgA [Alphaproteobacteria bacterium]